MIFTWPHTISFLISGIFIYVVYHFIKTPNLRPSIIICIEGLDGAGKNTISLEMRNRQKRAGFSSEKVSFPMYQAWHSFMVSLYLKGKIRKDPMKVNPYLASFFYAFDRYVAWNFHLREQLNNTDYIIFDRYTPSNIMYQGMKGKTDKAKNRIAWFAQFLEYTIFRLPKPDYIVVLRTPLERSLRNMDGRQSKDIHENAEFLSKVAASLAYFTEHFNWISIETTNEDTQLKTPTEIVDSIFMAMTEQTRIKTAELDKKEKKRV
jgi:dTMP kinase